MWSHAPLTYIYQPQKLESVRLCGDSISAIYATSSSHACDLKIKTMSCIYYVPTGPKFSFWFVNSSGPNLVLVRTKALPLLRHYTREFGEFIADLATTRMSVARLGTKKRIPIFGVSSQGDCQFWRFSSWVSPSILFWLYLRPQTLGTFTGTKAAIEFTHWTFRP